MKMRTKRVSLTAALLLMLVSVLFGAVACSNKPLEPEYTLPDNRNITVGVEFTPEFSTGKDTELEVVSFVAPDGSKAALDGLKFTPDVTGNYTFNLNFKTKDKSVSESVTFVAADITAPTVTKAPVDKTVETGFYHGVWEDILTTEATDNCATAFTYELKSLVFGNETTELEPEEGTLYLGRVGEYTVNFDILDYSGNRAAVSYKLNAVDTTAPVIQAPARLVSHVTGGKAKLPKLNAADIASTTLTVAVKSAGGGALSVTETANGFEFDGAAGEYTAEYTATDESDNKTTVEIPFTVYADGTILSFNNEGEETLLSGAEGYFEDNALRLVSDGSEAALTFEEWFTFTDWSGFKTFTADINNVKGSAVTVWAEVKVNGVWLKTESFEIGSSAVNTETYASITAKSGEVRFSLGAYGITKAEGIRLAFKGENGLDLAVDNVALSETDVVLDAVDEASLTGKGSGKIEIAPLGASVKAFEAIAPEANDNTVTFDLYANKNMTVLVGLTAGGKTTAERVRLSAGWNTVTRLIAAENTAFGGGLTAIRIENVEEFGATLYINNVAFERTEALEQSVYAKTNLEFGMAYGETLTVPNPFTYGTAYYSDLEISVLMSGTPVMTELTVGQAITNDEEIPFGTYTLRYTYTDALGASKTLDYTVNVMKKVLVATAPDTLIFMNVETTVSDPTLESEVYSQEQLDNAMVEKFYRRQGRYTWQDGNDGFVADSNTVYEIKYVITVGSDTRTVRLNKFAHKNKFTIDFEPETNYPRVPGEAPSSPNLPADKEDLSDRFLYDGGAYWKEGMELVPEGAVSGSYAYQYTAPAYGWNGFEIRPYVVNSIGINAVTFWLTASNSQNSCRIACATEEYRWINSELFDIMPGTHQYTVYFDESYKLDEINKLRSFTFLGVVPNVYRFDDIEFRHIDRLTATLGEYEDHIDLTAPFIATKPTVTSELFDVNTAVYKLTYTLDGGTETEVTPNSDGNYVVNFEKAGVAEFTWEISCGDRTRTLKRTVYAGMCRVDVEDVVKAGIKGEAIEFVAPAVSTTAHDMTLSVKEYTVSVRKDGAADWTKLEGTSFMPDETGYYNVRYDVTANIAGSESIAVGEKEFDFYVRNAGDKTLDYELDADGGNLGDFTPYDPIEMACPSISSVQAHSGKFSARMPMHIARWTGFNEMGVELNDSFQALNMWIYSPSKVSDMQVELSVSGVSGWVHWNVEINPGWNEYVLNFKDTRDHKVDTLNIGTLNGLIFHSTTTAVTFYLDDVRFVKNYLTVTAPEYEDLTDYTQPYSVAKPTVTSDIFDVNEAEFELKYSVDGGDEIAVAPESGEYVINFTSAGNVTLVWTVKVGDVIRTVEREIKVGMCELASTVKRAGIVDTEIDVPVPTVVGDGLSIESYTVSVKKDGEADFTALADKTKFTPDEAGYYTLRFEANVNGTVQLKGALDVEFYAREENTENHIDFELDENGNHYFDESYGEQKMPHEAYAVLPSSERAHGGKYSLKFRSHANWPGIWGGNIADAKPLFSLDGTYAQVTFWVYAESALTANFEFAINGVWKYASTGNKDIPAGTWTQLTIDISSDNGGVNQQKNPKIYRFDIGGTIDVIFYIDDIEFIPASSIAGEGRVNDYVYAGETNTEMTFATPTFVVGSVTEWTVSYRKQGSTDDWTVAPEHKATFTETGYYDVKYALVGETEDGIEQTAEVTKELYIREKGSKVVDFELDADGTLRGNGTQYSGASGDAVARISDDVNYIKSGKHSLYTQNISGFWNGWYGMNYALNGNFESVKFLAHSSNEFRIDLELYFDNGGDETNYILRWSPITLKAGWNEITLMFADSNKKTDTKQLGTFKNLDFGYYDYETVKGSFAVFFDDIEFLPPMPRMDLSEAVTAGEVNTATTLSAPKLNGTALADYSVSYRKEGTTAWNELSGNAFTPTEAGNYELKYSAEGAADGILKFYARNASEYKVDFDRDVNGMQATFTKGNLSPDYSTAKAHSGMYSLCFNGTNAWASISKLSYNVGGMTGAFSKVGFWVNKNVSNVMIIYVYINGKGYYCGDGALVGGEYNMQCDIDTWTYFEFTLPDAVKENATVTGFDVQCNNDGAKIYIDDIVFLA